MTQLSCAKNAIRLIFFSFGLAISSWAPLIPFIKQRLSLDDAELGMIFFVFGLGALLMMPISGYILSRMGSRRLIAFSSCATALLLLGLSVAPTAASLSAILFLFGIATSAMNVSMNAHAVEVEVASKEPIMSGIHGCFSLGGLCGAGLVSLLLNLGCQIFSSILAISSLVLLNLLWKSRYLLPDATINPASNNKTFSFAFPDRSIVFLGTLCFIAFMAEGAMLDWSAEYLHGHVGYEVSDAGIGYAVFSIFMAIGRFIGDRTIKQFGNIAIFQAGCLLSAAGLFGIVALHGYELIGFGLIGLGASNVVPILFSSTGAFTHVAPSYALSIVTTCGYIGILLGPALIGFIAEASNLSIAFAAVAALLAAIGLTGKSAIPVPTRLESPKG
jgi:predicted MFS family arabinose efflux permease